MSPAYSNGPNLDPYPQFRVACPGPNEFIQEQAAPGEAWIHRPDLYVDDQYQIAERWVETYGPLNLTDEDFNNTGDQK